jgi:arylsulfatase A-like enzyme
MCPLLPPPDRALLTAMLTGRLPIRSGIAGATWTGGVFNDAAVGGLPLNETTLAEALKATGYRTGTVKMRSRKFVLLIDCNYCLLVF